MIKLRIMSIVMESVSVEQKFRRNLTMALTMMKKIIFINVNVKTIVIKFLKAKNILLKKTFVKIVAL